MVPVEFSTGRKLVCLGVPFTQTVRLFERPSFQKFERGKARLHGCVVTQLGDAILDLLK